MRAAALGTTLLIGVVVGVCALRSFGSRAFAGTLEESARSGAAAVVSGSRAAKEVVSEMLATATPERVATAIASLLAEREVSIRRGALLLLKSMGSGARAATREILGAAREDSLAELSMSTLDGLGLLALPALQGIVNSDDQELGAKALVAAVRLQVLAPAGVVELLLRGANSKHAVTRATTISAVATLSVENLEALLRLSETGSRASLAIIARGLGGSKVQTVTIGSYLASTSMPRRIIGAVALGERHAEPDIAVMALLRHLQAGDDDEEVKAAAVRSLGELHSRDAEVCGELARQAGLAKGEDLQLAFLTAARELECQGSELLSIAAKLVIADNLRIRLAACWLLGSAGRSAKFAVPQLQARFEATLEDYERARVGWALLLIGGDAVHLAPVLARLAQSDDPDVKIEARNALHAHRGAVRDAIAESLVQLLESGSSVDQVAAADALGVVGSSDGRVIQALAKAEAAGESEVRSRARATRLLLERLGGK